VFPATKEPLISGSPKKTHPVLLFDGSTITPKQFENRYCQAIVERGEVHSAK